jgi:hypothetical protein
MTNQAAHMWTLQDEQAFMRDYQKWDLSRINMARQNVGMPGLPSRQDAFRAYARGLRRRTDWHDMMRHVPAVGKQPERWEPVTAHDVARLIDNADDMVGQFASAADHFRVG